MRILVCGSREWPGAWEDIGVHFPENGDVTIIHGACSRVLRGVQVSVDMIADWIAHGLGFGIDAYPVDHAKDGPWPGAGPQRNARMLRESRPDRGLAFGALWKEDIDPWRCNRCGAPCSRVSDHHPWCSTKFEPPQKPTGTGGMVAKMLHAGLPVRWIAAPGAEAIDLVTMPEPSP